MVTGKVTDLWRRDSMKNAKELERDAALAACQVEPKFKAAIFSR